MRKDIITIKSTALKSGFILSFTISANQID